MKKSLSICIVLCSDTAADIDQCCKDGVREAESCGDVEMQAEFLYCGAVFCLVGEKPVIRVMTVLQVCVYASGMFCCCC